MAVGAAAAVAATATAAPALAASQVGRGTTVSASMSHPDNDHAGAGGHEVAGWETAKSRLTAATTSGIPGMDVSGWQGNVDWATAWRNGARFAYVKATESTTYRNPYFSQQYSGSYGAGMTHGAYHFALPDRSSAITQARYFTGHGGGWSRDGRTLPPALDIEYNPYGPMCYGLSTAAMVSWIRAFSHEVWARAGRPPAIYTNYDWWSRCTGNYTGLRSTNPLWVARWSSTPGVLPGGWTQWRIWQTASAGRFPGDQNSFAGTLTGLRQYALNR
jgi:GH25 family lysozyme M1 (1,4-beta-N-acetylmuramidase)